MNQLSNQKLLQTYRRHAAPMLLESMLEEVVISGIGATLTCNSGRELIDMASGGFGYCHPTIEAAVKTQIKKGPLSSRILMSRPLAMLVKSLAEITPGDLTVSYVCNSGEEALDSALKLVKGYTPHKRKIVVASECDYGSFSHGILFAGIGDNYLSGLCFSPLKVPFGETDAMLQAIDRNTAAVLLPSVNVNDGVTNAANSFWHSLRTRCDETGTLLIVDERYTALGHTGKNFSLSHYGVVPDVLVLGGALGGGYISIGAYVTKEPINSKVYKRRNPTLHGSTTGANPASCVAALTALEVVEQDKLAIRHCTFGKILEQKLHELRQLYPQKITGFNSVGSLAAIAFSDAQLAREVHNYCLQRNLLLRVSSDRCLSLRPPLIISEREFRQGLNTLSEVIEECCSIVTVKEAV